MSLYVYISYNSQRNNNMLAALGECWTSYTFVIFSALDLTMLYPDNDNSEVKDLEFIC